MKTDNSIKRSLQHLRFCAILEGVSYLILLFLAMPLKYLMGVAIAVRVVGLAHGILFMVLCALLVYVWNKEFLPVRLLVLVFVASLIPFGAFWADRRLKPLV